MERPRERERVRERGAIFLNASPVNHLSRQKHFQVLLCVLSVGLFYLPVSLFDFSQNVKTEEMREAARMFNHSMKPFLVPLTKKFQTATAILFISVLRHGCLS